MGKARPVEKHSVTIPADTSAEIRARVGARGFSAYVAEAAARQLERDALDEMLARTEAAHGPVDEQAVAAILEQLTR